MTGQTALVTGANRGVGRELVSELVRRGARRVYATGRSLAALEPLVSDYPEKVVALHLDLQDATSIVEAASVATDVTLLINNAATLSTGSALLSDRATMVSMVMTNTFGTLDVIRAFTPVLESNGGGVVVNVMSLQAFSGSNGWDGYSASKAALQSLTQSMRPALKLLGIRISGAYPGGVDTDMIREFDTLKSSARGVAEGILDGIDAGEEDIFPDGVSRFVAELWRRDPKQVERLFADPDVLVPMLQEAHGRGDIVLA
ncbi:SDR family NAD(P)-dependent oxidoreductase [Longivirga aurantiaca]|uniref:SDR family NAD(P)-dependent oxidoreductase n=1 Tax=Longivirga aurantiaca TaxID=1837743 RepID=A0ABW1SYM7_9ACTN